MSLTKKKWFLVKWSQSWRNMNYIKLIHLCHTNIVRMFFATCQGKMWVSRMCAYPVFSIPWLWSWTLLAVPLVKPVIPEDTVHENQGFVCLERLIKANPQNKQRNNQNNNSKNKMSFISERGKNHFPEWMKKNPSKKF